MIALAETRTVLRSVLEEARLDESISQRQFWDFYAVFANGLEEIPGVDTEHIVDQAWLGVIEPYAKLVFNRLVQSAIVAMSKVPNADDFEDYDEGHYSMRMLPHIRKDLKKMFAAKTLPDIIAALEWFNTSEEAKRGDYADQMKDWFTSHDGVWAGLSKKIANEYRKHNASTKAKAMSVDLMLSWSHHNDTMASYVGKWLPQALDARSRGNMNTLLAGASQDVRDALKSAHHGIGRQELTMADRVEAELNRMSAVKSVKRVDSGHYTKISNFTVTANRSHIKRAADFKPGESPWYQTLETTEFIVADDGVTGSDGKFHPWIVTRPNGSKYQNRFSNMWGLL